jgi:predicted nucleic acid-binding protein
MIIFDTNVLSELMKPQGSSKIKLWVAQQIRAEVFITTITKAEILYGICIISSPLDHLQISNINILVQFIERTTVSRVISPLIKGRWSLFLEEYSL